MKIREYILRISGSANIEQPLKSDHDYALGLIANVYAVEKKSNQDNSYNLVYKCKPTGEISIKSDLGEKIVAQVKGSSLSKRMRDKWFAIGYDYDEDMEILLKYPEEAHEALNKLNKQ